MKRRRSQQTRVSAQHGADAVRETVAGMSEIKTVVTQAATNAQELGKLGQKIGAVVETIDDIADQTNLLALNAAIEAARAGEHGGASRWSPTRCGRWPNGLRETKQIRELIKEVQAATQQAVSAMETGAQKVDQGTAKADLAQRALGEILEAVDDNVQRVTEIASAALEMAASSRKVADAMYSMGAVVEENTAATEQMAAQAAEVNNAINSIAR